ncbi:MAG: serine hydrolase domain-containing protein [Phenylobacterium sp.]|uniref:serine hydrolase domain-containing protein n=1 Tax=Phenylobacterium sp. TaxID=1871053 RepID=UPI00272F220A|nr:serine hydrolase domain-containing protein [Phenylobacterium sp.]MDP2009022.1 serine hydrolase domain-containing protein [Phenylobacterium sp.]
MSLTIHGFCEPPFGPVADAFRANFEAGLEIGASLAMTYKDRLVVDLWAGWRDEARTVPWTEDTIVRVASTGKAPVALSALMLADRGLLDLYAPVANYWPEFAQGGKGEVLVRHALSHQAGVPGLDPGVTAAQLTDWDYMAGRIAAEPHWFDGRRRLVYHGHTYIHLVGELVRRIDGRRPSEFVRDELMGPLEADFHLGVSDDDLRARWADEVLHSPPPPPSADLRSRIMRTIQPGQLPLAAAAPLAAVANARGIARVMAVVAGRGQVAGRRYLDGKWIDMAGRGEVYEECPLMGWLRFGLGFGLHSDRYPLPTPNMMGWGGRGGSWALADPSFGFTLGYAPNNWDLNAQPVDPRLVAIGRGLRTLVRDLPAPDAPIHPSLDRLA